jgi:TatD DNase family protein
LLDCHCHLDHYDDPRSVAAEAHRRGVFTVAVTNLPSHFRQGLPHAQALVRVRLALGLHPLAASSHEAEIPLFRRLLPTVSFVGEVGLDFSSHGAATRTRQVATFREVARSLADAGPKFVSLHSRGAESAVLEILVEAGVREAIFHWFTGSASALDQVAAAGHLFSINPAMVTTKKGRSLIERISPDKVLTESDGPYASVAGAPAMPWDVAAVESYLASAWRITQDDVRARVWANFRRLADKLRSPASEPRPTRQ